jgi:hypothetical protein
MMPDAAEQPPVPRLLVLHLVPRQASLDRWDRPAIGRPARYRDSMGE